MDEEWKADVEAQLQLLRFRADASRWLIKGLAIALTRSAPKDAAALVELLGQVAAFVHVTQNPRTAEAMLADIAVLNALIAHTDPLMAMGAQILMQADAGPGNAAALQTWLQQATPEEIADQLQTLFEKLRVGSDRTSQSPDR